MTERGESFYFVWKDGNKIWTHGHAEALDHEATQGLAERMVSSKEKHDAIKRLKQTKPRHLPASPMVTPSKAPSAPGGSALRAQESIKILSSPPDRITQRKCKM